MNTDLKIVKDAVYDKCNFNFTDLTINVESKEYEACQFKLNGMVMLCRNSKITPKKVGQFVTFWKRNEENIIEPYNYLDNINFYIVNVRKENKLGQFVFPKNLLIKQGILSSEAKDGKRGFRIYPSWDIVKNKQAERTQKWQMKFFYIVNNDIDFNHVKKLYIEP